MPESRRQAVETPPPRTRVLIADDHPRVREGLRALLEPARDIDVVGLAGGGAEAAIMAADLRPDVVVMDVNMPAVGGLEATKRILAVNPAVRIIVLTAQRGREVEAYAAGAVAHLLKDASPDELLRCVREHGAAGAA